MTRWLLTTCFGFWGSKGISPPFFFCTMSMLIARKDVAIALLVRGGKKDKCNVPAGGPAYLRCFLSLCCLN